MAQKFDGTVYGNDAKELADVYVQLKKNKEKIGETFTNKKGYFSIISPTDLDPKDVTITISKDKHILYNLSNPQPTSYSPPATNLDPINGGVLDLSSFFASGKYNLGSIDIESREQLFWELQTLLEFIKNNTRPNGQNNYIVTIIASESQVTNYDREAKIVDPATGKIIDNPNWAGPENEFREEGKLTAGLLSERRFNTLKTYVENSIKEFNGGTLPSGFNIEKKVLIGGEKYNRDVNFKERNTIKYTKDQYVKIIVKLVSAVCRESKIQNPDVSVDKILVKPLNSTKIDLNAYAFPDRFGINNKLNSFYSLEKESNASVDTWGFLIYLNLLINDPLTLKNDTTLTKTKITWDNARKILVNDFGKEREGGFISQVNKFLELSRARFQINTNLSLPNNFGTKLDEMESFLKNNYKVYEDLYSISVKLGNTAFTFSELNPPVVGEDQFILNSRNGNLDGISIFSFKICAPNQ